MSDDTVKIVKAKQLEAQHSTSLKLESSVALPISNQAIMAPRLQSDNLTRQTILDLIYSKEPKLLVIQAGAGMGKTVLLAQHSWEQRTRARKLLAWLSLSADEQEPRRFLGALSLSLRRACPEVGERLQLLLLSSAEVSQELAMMLLCNELSQSEKPITLVLDNCEAIVAPQVWAMLDILIKNSGDGFQLLCSSRQWVPLLDKRLLLDGQHLMVNSKSLQFSPAEAKDYMRSSFSWELPELAMHICYKQSLGWPLFLAAIKNTFIAEVEFKTHDFDQLMKPYFDDYCCSYSTQEIEIIACACLLNTPSSEIVSAILAVDVKIVEQVFFRELNILSSEDDLPILHPIFKRYIQSLNTQQAPQEQHELHRKAAKLYADNGEVREAVYHCLFTNDSAGVLLYFEDVMMDMMLKSQLDTLNEWLLQLRGLDVTLTRHQKGVLELTELWAKAFLFQHDEVTDQLQVIHDRIDNDEIFLTDTAYITLKTIKTLNYAYNERFEDASELALEVLASKVEISHWIRGILQNIMSYSAILKLDFDLSAKYQIQLSSHLDDKNLFVKTYSEVLQGHCMVKCARWKEAERYLRNGLDISKTNGGGYSIATGVALGFLSEFYYETFQLDAIEHEVWFHLDVIDSGALIDSSYRAYLSLARVLAVRLEYNRAHELLERGVALARERNWDRMLAACLCEHIKFYTLQSRKKKATECLNQLWSLDERNNESEPIVKAEIRYFLLMAQAIGDSSEFTNVELIDEIKERINFLESHGAVLYAQRLKVALVMYYFRTNNGLAGEQLLLLVVEFGLERESPSLLLDSGEAIILTVADLLERKPELKHLKRTWQKLIAKLDQQSQVISQLDVGSGNKDSLRSILSDKELEIITLLSSGLSNKDISDLLDISVGTVKWHLSNLYRKMSVSSRTEAVFEAKVQGLVM